MIGEIAFYKDPGRNYRNECECGQFFYAPVPYMLKRRVPRLKLDYYDPENRSNSSYTIGMVDIQEFRPEEAEPIHELGLASDEPVLCVAHKFRPVIVLSQEILPWKDCRRKPDDCYIAIPLYSTKDPADEYKFSEQFLLHVQAYQYPPLFFLPEDKGLGIRESLTRLDRAVAIHREVLKPYRASLTSDALYCLTRWFHYYIGAELDEILDYYRQAALEQLESED